jgi:hypothetical protein
MSQIIYGVLNSELCLIDTSKTERGAKQHATRNGYNLVGFRVGYNAFILAEKINGKWVTKDNAYSVNSAN